MTSRCFSQILTLPTLALVIRVTDAFLSGWSSLTFSINEAFLPRKLVLTRYFLFSYLFSVNPRDGCLGKNPSRSAFSEILQQINISFLLPDVQFELQRVVSTIKLLPHDWLILANTSSWEGAPNKVLVESLYFIKIYLNRAYRQQNALKTTTKDNNYISQLEYK